MHPLRLGPRRPTRRRSARFHDGCWHAAGLWHCQSSTLAHRLLAPRRRQREQQGGGPRVVANKQSSRLIKKVAHIQPRKRLPACPRKIAHNPTRKRLPACLRKVAHIQPGEAPACALVLLDYYSYDGVCAVKPTQVGRDSSKATIQPPLDPRAQSWGRRRRGCLPAGPQCSGSQTCQEELGGRNHGGGVRGWKGV